MHVNARERAYTAHLPAGLPTLNEEPKCGKLLSPDVFPIDVQGRMNELPDQRGIILLINVQTSLVAQSP